MTDTVTLPDVDVRPVHIHLAVDTPPDMLNVVTQRITACAALIALDGLSAWITVDGGEHEDEDEP